MPIEQLLSDGLLDPITADRPAGASLRWLPEWDRVKDARQTDDGLGVGKWAKKDPKSADWRLVRELTSAMLRTRSKDLQLGMWFTEASVKLHGFPGLRDGLAVICELMIRFWDSGLFPVMKDGPEDRSGPFEWLNDKLGDTILTVAVTCCPTQDRNFSVLDLRDARLVGSLAHCKDDNGDDSPPKRRQYEKALSEGRTSMDMFEGAFRESRRASYEQLISDFDASYEEFRRLERLVDEKFGDAAPNLAALRATFADTQQELSTLLEKKRKEEPSTSVPIQPDNTVDPAATQESITVRFPLLSAASGQKDTSDSWQEAERLVRSGQVDAGLSEMTRLAANETSGRSRFERKLLLAEVCLTTRRERLAKAILEELAEQIDRHQLETWESSELVSGVWTRLYELLKRSGSSDSDEAAKLYGRICRLDPWQALACSE